MTTWTRNLLNEALRYFYNGLFVIPLCDRAGNPSKSPLWAKEDEIIKLTEQPQTEEQIRDWWTRCPSANIGIVTGPVSGVIVQDLDPDAAASAGRDVDEIRRLLETSPFCVHTGRPGGLHGWFAYDPSLEWIGLSRPTKPLEGPLRIGKGVDLPWYVVAPPSVHPETGKLYAWKGPSLLDVAKSKLPNPPKEFYHFIKLNADGSPDLEKKKICDLLLTEQLTKGNRKNTLASLAGYLIEHHPKDIVVALLKNWNHANMHVPLRDKQIVDCVESVKKTRDRKTWRRDVIWEQKRVDFPTEDLFSDNPVVFDYIDGLAKRDNLDPSMIGLSVFCAVATCMQGRYQIYGTEDWNFPPTFFAMIGCPTGTRKSIPHKNIMIALEPSLQYLKDEWGTKRDIYKREWLLDSYEKTDKKKKDPFKDIADDKLKEAIEFFRKYKKPFIPISDHATPQGVRDDLIDQGQTNAYAEEARAFFEGLIFNTEKSHVDVFIRAYDGMEQSRRLVGRGYAKSDGQTHATLHLMIQNNIMEEIFTPKIGKNQPALDNQGFFPRFLFGMPQRKEAIIGHLNQEDDTRFRNARKQLSNILLDIVQSPPKQLVYQGNNEFINAKQALVPSFVKHPQGITFTKEALEALGRFQETLTKQSMPGYALARYINWTQRAATHAMKISAFLHHLKQPGVHDPVPLSAMEKAISFIQNWAIPHMKIAYEKMSFNEPGRDAHDIWTTFVKADVSQMQMFTYRQLSEATRNWSRRKIRLQESLEYLHQEGFIKPSRSKQPLMHPDQSFECNPYVRF